MLNILLGILFVGECAPPKQSAFAWKYKIRYECVFAKKLFILYYFYMYGWSAAVFSGVNLKHSRATQFLIAVATIQNQCEAQQCVYGKKKTNIHIFGKYIDMTAHGLSLKKRLDWNIYEYIWNGVCCAGCALFGDYIAYIFSLYSCTLYLLRSRNIVIHINSEYAEASIRCTQSMCVSVFFLFRLATTISPMCCWRWLYSYIHIYR